MRNKRYRNKRYTVNFKKGISFDDVLIEPRYAEILPHEVDIRTTIAPGINLQIPIVSAAMDTVTGSTLAQRIAECGGIGFLHRNCSIEEQVSMVTSVKRSQGSVVLDPICVSPETPLSEVERLSKKQGISRFPVIDKENKVIGIVTSEYSQLYKLLDVGNYQNLKVSDVMSTKVVTVLEGTQEEEALRIIVKDVVPILPIVDSKGRLKGIFTRSDFLKRGLSPNATRDDNGRLRVVGTTGVTGDYLERAQELVKAGADAICVEVAHINTKNGLKAIEILRTRLPEQISVIAGNIATYEDALAVLRAGAQAVKVGLGPGAICTTRVISGAGVPQLSAILEVRKGCQEFTKTTGIEVYLIADGGIKYSGDITKALAAGANAVMIGSLFAGTDESPGERLLFEGRYYKKFWGMGSEAARKTDRYAGKVAEGVEGMVPYAGPLDGVLSQLIGGLKVGMGYTGSHNISDLQTDITFIEVSRAVVQESHPHGVFITKEPPNYPIKK